MTDTPVADSLPSRLIAGVGGRALIIYTWPGIHILYVDTSNSQDPCLVQAYDAVYAARCIELGAPAHVVTSPVSKGVKPYMGVAEEVRDAMAVARGGA